MTAANANPEITNFPMTQTFAQTCTDIAPTKIPTIQSHHNSIRGPRAKQCTCAPAYTTTHGNKNVNGL